VADDEPVHSDVVVVAETEKLLACELGAVVRDDGVQDPEAVDDVNEGVNGLLGTDIVD
jgi:hypothetical protein